MAVLSAMFSLAASRQAVPGGGSHCGGLRCAQTPLRCSPQGRAAELAARALRAPLEQPRRVSLRSALRAPTLRLRSSSPQRSPPPGTACREAGLLVLHRWRAQSASAKPACRAYRPGGASGTPSSARVSVGAHSALRALARRSCLSGARKARAASSSARPNPEQRRGVAAGDRSSEAPRPVCAQT